MKKNFLVIFLIFVVSVSVFCFLKYGQKKFEEYSFLKNKNHEYVLAVLQSSADNKKKNYLSDFYFDKKNKTMSVEEYNNFLHRDKRINSITRADIYYILGNVYLKKKDYANACYCYKKAFYFAPYNTEIKYDIKKFINFTDKILVPEKLLENNYAKSVEQLKIFIKNKETYLDKKTEDIKNKLKISYLKNIKFNEDIKFLNNKNKDNLRKEISSIEKEKETVEKKIKQLKEKVSKQEISETENIKKELLKKFPKIIAPFKASVAFWRKLEKSVIKRVSKNFINSETKTVQDKYFAEDIFLHKKNIWKFLINDFQSKNDTKYANTVTRNIYFINYKKQAVFNELSNKEKELFKDIISTDEKAVRFFARRAKQLFEEKNNISLLLNDISAKKKELYAFINSNANSQKKKNLQKELDKIKEKEKALRLESAECSKDLAELELIKENLLVYNEINILEIKDYIFAESLEINKSLGVVNEYIKFFMEKQKSLLNSLQENLKNVNMFDYTELKKCGNNLLICDENFSNMVQQQTFFNEQQNFLISNYTNLLLEIKKYIDGADVADGDEFFNKLKSFIDKEINIFSAKEKVLNKSFEYDKIYKLQNDIFSSDLTAKRKIDALGNLLETKNAIKGLFPKEQEPKKVKSKKRQEKTIVSKMKNYEVNTETVQKEVSSKKKKKKNKKKKK